MTDKDKHCFWKSGCSNNVRCTAFGECVAAFQNKHKLAYSKIKELEQVKAEIKKHFVEQACEAAHALFKDNKKQEDIFYSDIAQALREKFK